jgi:hypothetical protein
MTAMTIMTAVATMTTIRQPCAGTHPTAARIEAPATTCLRCNGGCDFTISSAPE